MKQSIIGEIYFSWTKGELKKLNKFISTSHWSKSETMIQCHNCIAAYTNKEKLDQLTKEILFKAVYPKDDYNDNKLRFTLNRLMEAIKEFILLEENEKKNIHSEKIWMDFIQNKKLKKNILLNIESEYSFKNMHDRLIYNYYKSAIKGNYVFNFATNIEERFKALLDMSHSVEEFSDYIFLKQYALMNTFNTKYQSQDFQLVLSKYNYIKNNLKYQNIIEFQVYISLIEMLLNSQSEYYYAYKNLVFQSLNSASDEDKIDLISYLLNYTSNQINLGKIEFIDEQYQLYIFFEKYDIYNISQFLSSSKVNNIVFIFLKKKDFTRAEKFIEDYVTLLPKEIMDSCRHFNLARIRFEKKMYKESLRELLKVDFGRDAFYSINSKVLLLKNYFEIKESDALSSLVISFKEYIKKNKVISESHKISIINFLKMVDKIYGATPSKAKKLDEDIYKQTQIAEKSWLLEKISEKIR